MSDSKAKYSSGVLGQKLSALSDAGLNAKLRRAAARAAKYGDNWRTVDINDFVERFAPGCVPVIEGSKILFQAEHSTLRIVCDVAAGSCRLQDLSITTSRCYLDINGYRVDNNIMALLPF